MLSAEHWQPHGALHMFTFFFLYSAPPVFRHPIVSLSKYYSLDSVPTTATRLFILDTRCHRFLGAPRPQTLVHHIIRDFCISPRSLSAYRHFAFFHVLIPALNRVSHLDVFSCTEQVFTQQGLSFKALQRLFIRWVVHLTTINNSSSLTFLK